MSPLIALLSNILVSLAVGTLLVGVMTQPLRLILKHICPGTDATIFWVAVTAVMFYLTPLMSAVLFMPTASLGEPVAVIRTALLAALFGAAAALLFVGYQVAKGRPQATTAVAQAGGAE